MDRYSISRNLHVDRLRGAASLGVVLSHAGGSGILNALPYILPLHVILSILANAYHAVVLFFVISGFLITNKILMVSDGSGRFSLKKFYVDRIARIAPCLILTVVTALALALCGSAAFKVDWFIVPSALWAIFTFHFNVWLHFDASELRPRVWDPLWSLSIEEVFYLVFPALIIALPRRALMLGLVALLIIGPLCRTDPRPFYNYFSNFDQLSIGVLTAFGAWRARSWPLSHMTLRLCRWFGFGLILATFIFTQDTLETAVWGPEFIGAGAALYLFGTTTPQRPRSFGLLWLPAIFGRLSYEIYLIHMFLLVGIGVTTTIPTRAENPLCFDILILPGFMIALLTLSALIAKFYSEPANRWIRQMIASDRARSMRNRAAPVRNAHQHRLPAKQAFEPVESAAD